MNQSGERVVKIKKLLFYILKSYKWIALVAVIGAVTLGALRLYLDYNNLQAEESRIKEEEQYKQYTDEELLENFEYDEKQDIMLAIDYYEKYMDTRVYMDESLAMNLNANKVGVSSIQLIVDIPENVAENEAEQNECQNAILNSYLVYVNSGELIDDIYKDMKVDISAEYIQELIVADFSMVEDAITENNVCLFIKIYESDELANLAEYVVQAMQDYSAVVTNNISNHTVKVVDIYDGIVSDYDLYTRQQNMWNAVANYQSKWKNAKNSLSEEQLKYYDYLVSESKGEETNSELLENEAYLSVNYIYILFGAILGMIFACFIVVFKCMLSRCVIAETDYSTIFGLKYFGMLFEERENALQSASFIKRLEYGDDALCDYEDNVSIITLKIKLACKAAGIDKLALVSSNIAIISEDIINDILVKLEKEDIKLVVLDRVLTNGKQMSDLFDIGCCALMEKSEVSRVNDIQNLMELCHENNIDVLGVIDIKK